MKATAAAATIVSLAWLAASHPSLPPLSPRGSPILKRWDYYVCSNDCSLAGFALPDKDNFQLPLENN